MNTSGKVESLTLGGVELMNSFDGLAVAAHRASVELSHLVRGWQIQAEIKLDQQARAQLLWIGSRVTPPMPANATSKEFRRWRRKLYRQLRDDHMRWIKLGRITGK
jgi:hypothetical protein